MKAMLEHKLGGRRAALQHARAIGSHAAAMTALVAATLAGCGNSRPAPGAEKAASGSSAAAQAARPAASTRGPVSSLPPNEMGVIPVLEYHLISDTVKGEFERPPARFRQDLEELYSRGYRPISIADVLDKKIQQLPKGISPVVFTFDDAPTSQFAYLGAPGRVDPRSAIGIWLDFQKSHPDWGNGATFCMLSGAQLGRSLFGDKGINGQQTAWRFIKVKWLAERGFELCNHTLWHARLDKYPDGFVQEQIARGQMAIDSAVPGYRVRTFALPLGMWPKNKPLAWQGSWTDPRSHQSVPYRYDAVLEVAGNPNLNPSLPGFDPHHINRQIMTGNALENTLKRLESSGPKGRWISDGDAATLAKPPVVAASAASAKK